MKDQHVFNILPSISRRAKLGRLAATCAPDIAREFASRAANGSGR